MGRPGPATHAKRQRERAKKEKQKAKAEERALRKEQKVRNSDQPLPPGHDPDLEGIVPGPQKPLFD
jgi:sRNA-binding protein